MEDRINFRFFILIIKVHHDYNTKINYMGTNNYSLLYRILRRIFALKLDDARLVLAIKLTKLLGGIVFVMIAIMLFLCMLGFISVAIGQLLSTVMHPVWAYLIIALFYLLIFVIIAIFRDALIMNPIARFISKLVIESPVTNKQTSDDHEKA